MAIFRAVVKSAAEWRFLAEPKQSRPLSDGPLGRDGERRRLHRLIATGEHLGLPVGVIVEIRETDS